MGCCTTCQAGTSYIIQINSSCFCPPTGEQCPCTGYFTSGHYGGGLDIYTDFICSSEVASDCTFGYAGAALFGYVLPCPDGSPDCEPCTFTGFATDEIDTVTLTLYPPGHSGNPTNNFLIKDSINPTTSQYAPNEGCEDNNGIEGEYEIGGVTPTNFWDVYTWHAGMD